MLLLYFVIINTVQKIMKGIMCKAYALFVSLIVTISDLSRTILVVRLTLLHSHFDNHIEQSKRAVCAFK
jgi:hypothetical protein